MDSKRLIMLLIAGVVVAFGAMGIRAWVSAVPEEPVVAANNHVLVAVRDLPPGAIVQGQQDIDWREMPPEAIKDTHLREGSVRLEDFFGAVTRKPMRAGEALTQSTLTRAGEGGFMSAVLEPNMRAISIAVNATSGNAGFISPGDRVDLIVTHKLRAPGGANSNEGAVVSETFVRDVRVIAVDQMLDNPDNKAILAKTVTVEVSPTQAEQISVAGEMGKISIALRSLASQEPAKPATTPDSPPAPEGETPVVTLQDLYGGFTSESDVSRVSGRNEGIMPNIRVIRGDQVENVQLQ